MVKRRQILAGISGFAIVGYLSNNLISSPNKGVPPENKTLEYTRKIHQNTIEITYSFGNTRQIESNIEIPLSLYNDHTQGSDIYHKEILESSSDSFVDDEISGTFIPNYNNKEVWNIMRFVQGIRYSRDWNTTDATDYTRHPVETIVDMVGDCKDKTNLLYSILKNRGYNMGYVIFPQHISPIISKNETSASKDDIEIMHKNEQYEYVVLESTYYNDIGQTGYNKSNIIYAYTDYGGFSIKNPNAIGDQIKKMISDEN